MPYIIGLATAREQRILQKRGWHVKPLPVAMLEELEVAATVSTSENDQQVWVAVEVDNIPLTHMNCQGLLDKLDRLIQPYPVGTCLFNQKPALSNDFDDGEERTIPIGTPCRVAHKRWARDGDYVIFEVAFEGGGSVFCTEEELTSDFVYRVVHDHDR